MKESRFFVFLFLLIVWLMLVAVNIRYGEGKELKKKDLDFYSLRSEKANISTRFFVYE